MGRCKDCKWWENPSILSAIAVIGRCLCPKVLKVVVMLPFHRHSELWVAVNFGCIHFRRKTSLEDMIEELVLSVLPLRALKSSGIKKVGDLVGRTPRELLVMRKVGEKSLQKIESQLQEYDLVERQDEDGCIHFERKGK